MKVHIFNLYFLNRTKSTASCNSNKHLIEVQRPFDLYDDDVCARCRDSYLGWVTTNNPNPNLQFGRLSRHLKPKSTKTKKLPKSVDVPLPDIDVTKTLYKLLMARRLLSKHTRILTRYHKPVTPTTEPGSFFQLYKECYRKEARAMLVGKHWQGKNRCVTLPGDVPA
jgi:hypothetical protein